MLCWYLRNMATNNAFLLTHREEVWAKRRLDCFLLDSVTGKASQLRLSRHPLHPAVGRNTNILDAVYLASLPEIKLDGNGQYLVEPLICLRIS